MLLIAFFVLLTFAKDICFLYIIKFCKPRIRSKPLLEKHQMVINFLISSTDLKPMELFWVSFLFIFSYFHILLYPPLVLFISSSCHIVLRLLI